MDILKLTLLTLLTLCAAVACDYIGDSLTSNTDVTVNVGSGASTGLVTTVTPRVTVTPTVTTTPPTEATPIVTPKVF